MPRGWPPRGSAVSAQLLDILRAQAAHGNAEIRERVLGWLDAYLTSR